MISDTTIQCLKPVQYLRQLFSAFSTRLIASCRRCSLRNIISIYLLSTTVWLSACNSGNELSNTVSGVTFKTLSGQQIAIEDTKAPVLINFWSTSCVICIAEMPELAQLYKDYAALGVQIIAVAMPYDPPNEVLELAQTRQLPFSVALDIHGEAEAAFGPIKGTPTSFLLDANGRVTNRYVGAIEFDSLRDDLNKLLEAS